jgi:uncharacterized membrane protein
MDAQNQLEQLQFKLENLKKRQSYFENDIKALELEIEALAALIKAQTTSQTVAQETVVVVKDEVKPIIPLPEPKPTVVEEKVQAPIVEAPKPIIEIPKPTIETPKPQTKVEPIKTAVNSSSNSSLEKYIGQNLIPVIGIIITVIGVGIGAKYAIDHQLVSPLTRIILGYVMASGLLFFALKLKAKYKQFSAILLSGSLAIFYFITFFAYSFYQLFPVQVAFVAMLVITAAAVYASIKYNLIIISHIGLVGAYAVPFLLSDGSGRVGIFFSYISIINIGILAVSFFRNWKSLYYVSFGLTWFIFLLWFATGYNDAKHFNLAMIFVTVFFLIFHATNLAYKLVKKEIFDELNVMMVLLNSFLFYGLGIAILMRHESVIDYKAWFTLLNGVIHLAVAALLYFLKTEDKKFHTLSVGLAISYFTLYVPIELDGRWITFLWIFEAALLFWIGRTKASRIYEFFAYPLMLLGFISLVINWVDVYADYYWNVKDFNLFFNINFLTSLVYGLVLLFIYMVSKISKFQSPFANNPGMLYLTQNLIFVLLLIVLYLGIHLELNHFWVVKYQQSITKVVLWNDYTSQAGDSVLKSMKTVSSIFYGLIFVSALGFFKRKSNNSEEFNMIFFMGFIFALFFFLTLGLYELNSMHLKYIYAAKSHIFYRGFVLIGIRYIGYAIVAFAMFIMHHFVKNQMKWNSMKIISEYILHTVIVWVISAEIVNWMHTFGSNQAYKLAISIFAGFYSLFLIMLGIWKNKIYLRIGAFALFGITLVKLFFYDIAQLDTIFKTVIFISLGLLLLVISFLYNKYKKRLFGED